MRISDLSRSSGVALPTIKYYLREGLLEPGERTSANQAVYGEAHLDRLRLVRVLLEVGGLSIAAVKKVIAALTDERVGVHDLLGAVQYALVAAEPRTDEPWLAALADVDAYLAQHDWRVRPDAPARYRLADVLHGLRAVRGEAVPASCFDPYAEVGREMGRAEVAHLPDADVPREQLVSAVTVGVAVFETAITAFRLLGQEDASARRYAGRAAADSR